MAEVEKNVEGKRVKVEGEDDGEDPKQYVAFYPPVRYRCLTCVQNFLSVIHIWLGDNRVSLLFVESSDVCQRCVKNESTWGLNCPSR